MDSPIALVTEWLLSASSQVGSEYIQLPVAGREDCEYRERVYCYELYHHWRNHWPNGFRFSLSGEVDKAGHPLIRNRPKPDFLVHVPGRMDNLLIVEVKPVTANISEMANDLAKLTWFRRGLRVSENYRAAYFWVYGSTVEGWPKIRERLHQELNDGDYKVDLALISCFVHDHAGIGAEKVEW
jgi:hypothetical protein